MNFDGLTVLLPFIQSSRLTDDDLGSRLLFFLNLTLEGREIDLVDREMLEVNEFLDGL
jgi:hypothetical protein